ncbi:cinnamoyl-CoA reductase CAD2 isoform X2 [Ziziphus jujuba]|uniref:Cinnamoyl-CoA reductase CAD2 isoform X2 n=1 Tax=Ziziphus jujuba TaxID=326968 RepID=A0ABM3IS09_ZIZJJ|nr:cinnamoyl-CoA reductase CAD2 isoform X2 [Ziziphus jujuba]
MSGEEKVVCVTGASGYIASWLVKLLLERGFRVKASVRDPDDPRKTEHLLSLEGAKERLHLLRADLLEEGAFDALVEGCEGVFHTASPTTLSANDPQLWYILSKTLAEEAAWKFAKENGIDLVTIHPGVVIGPLLQPTLNLSSEMFINLIKGGAKAFPFPVCRIVDIRDVAFTHIQALEVPSASGRYCLVGHVVHIYEALKILKELYPALSLPEECEDEKPLLPKHQVSKEKAKSLVVNFTSLEVSFRDTIESLKEKGFIDI